MRDMTNFLMLDEKTPFAIRESFNMLRTNLMYSMKKGTDAYKQMVNERMREIVYQTQVVDSTMTRSDIMRDTGAKSSLATAFMSEPTLAMNMLADSIYEQRMKARAAGKKMIAPSGKMMRAFAVYVYFQKCSQNLDHFVSS